MSQSSLKVGAYRRKPAPQRRRELIQAGINCLARGGMSAFTIDQICTEAGVSRGLINHHFHSKDELLVCIYSTMTQYLVAESATTELSSQAAEIIEANFDERSFKPANLRAWLSIWGEVATHETLRSLHQERYNIYKSRVIAALADCRIGSHREPDLESVARQLIALIDGLWLEYCLHSASFSLLAARADCYRFLRAYGIELEARGTEFRGKSV